MVTVKVCTCGHFEDDHFPDGCFKCRYYHKYGESKEKKNGTTCKHPVYKYDAELMICDETPELHTQDHGILTLNLCFKNGSSHQCYGGISLDTYSKEEECRIGSVFGLTVVRKLLDWCDVTRLSEIKGMYFWVLRESYRGMICGLVRVEVDKEYKDDNPIFSYEQFEKYIEKEKDEDEA